MNAWWNLRRRVLLTKHSLQMPPSKSEPFPRCRSDAATRMFVATICLPARRSGSFLAWSGIFSAMATSFCTTQTQTQSIQWRRGLGGKAGGGIVRGKGTRGSRHTHDHTPQRGSPKSAIRIGGYQTRLPRACRLLKRRNGATTEAKQCQKNVCARWWGCRPGRQGTARGMPVAISSPLRRN
jgi:hypothetical protein